MRNQIKQRSRWLWTSLTVACFSAAFGAALMVSFQVGRAQQRVPVRSLPGSANPRTESKPTEHYRIGPGDVLEIRLYKLPELSREALRVGENGTIRMPLINEEIRTSCRTERELADEITARYRTYMTNPQVDVFIKEYNSRPVAVIGAVNTPGRFQLQRRIRLLDLLSFAGGPAERAGGNIQLVHTAAPLMCELENQNPARNSGSASAMDVFKLSDTLRGEIRANPYVRAGDIITVLESPQIHVVGNVVRPTSLPLKERINLSQAIAMAGGILPDTQKDRIRIIRQHPGNNRQEILVDLKAVASRQARDIELQANDIVEVPLAGGKRFLRRLMGDVVPSVARLPLYVVR